MRKEVANTSKIWFGDMVFFLTDTKFKAKNFEVRKKKQTNENVKIHTF